MMVYSISRNAYEGMKSVQEEALHSQVYCDIIHSNWELKTTTCNW